MDLGLKKGDKGTILGPKRNGYWLVVFEGEFLQNKNGVWYSTGVDVAVTDEDVKVIWECPE